MSYLVKNAHFIFIHVPIAMLLFSFVFDLLAVLLKKRDWHAAGMLCLVVGTLGAIAAVITGPEGERNQLLPQHELFGKLTMITAIILTGLRLWLLLKSKLEIGGDWRYLTVALAVVLLVTYTGHLGGKMVHPDRPEQRLGPGFGGDRPQGERGFNRQNGGGAPGTSGGSGAGASGGAGTASGAGASGAGASGAAGR